MTDLVERLRLLGVGEGDYRTADDAANEIERLRAALAAAEVGEQADIDDLSFQLRAVKVELRLAEEQIERLQKERAKLLDDHLGTPCEQIRHQQEIHATIEHCAQVAERLAEDRRKKEQAAGYGPRSATQQANHYWCEEIAAHIRRLNDRERNP